MWSRKAACTVIGTLCLGFPAAATAGWSTPESASGAQALTLAQGGTGLILGYPDSGHLRVADRPPGGPVGAPGSLGVDTSDYPIIATDAAGNALMASRSARQVAFRPAGGSAGAPQSLGVGNSPALISMAATG